jgi:hypothetical protein
VAKEIVSGTGKDARRTDKNISSRVQKIQRDANMKNATGGSYGESLNLQQLSQGASTSMKKPIISPTTSRSMPSLGLNKSPLDQMQEGEVTMTDGAGGNTAGRQPSELDQPIDAPDQSAILARAMFAINPTPQNRRLLEAFQQEGR